MLPMLLPDAVTVWDVPAVKLRLLVERVRAEPPPFTVTVMYLVLSLSFTVMVAVPLVLP